MQKQSYQGKLMQRARNIVFTAAAILAMSINIGNAVAADEIVIFGASGKIGGLIVQEALDRGHKVVGVSRNPDKLSFENENFSAKAGSVTDVRSVQSLTENAKAVIVSVGGSGAGNFPHTSPIAIAAQTMIEAFSGDEDAPHIIQVGGATTVYPLIEDMQANLPFPAEPGSPMHGMLFGHRLALDSYRTSNIPWTVLTPPRDIMGWSFKELTDVQSSKKEYRTSTTDHLRDADGKSRIWVKDLARAAIDEVENKQFVRQRFIVGY